MSRKRAGSPGQEPLFVVTRHQRRGVNARSLGTTIRALRDAGCLEAIDEALVTATRVAAQAVDAAIADPEESRYVASMLRREYRETLLTLRAMGVTSLDPLNDLIASLSAPMGDPADAGLGDDRPPDRPGGPRPR